jgi:lysine 6-dehydrogenase
VLGRGPRLDRFDPATRITAMMRTTGYSLAITGALQAAGDVEPGVWTPDEGVPAEPYIQALAQRGIEIRETRLAGAAAAA